MPREIDSQRHRWEDGVRTVANVRPLPPVEPVSADGPAVAIQTLGCKLNQADSNRLAWEFIEAGFRLVAPDEPADVFVVNTCTVTHVADRKARHALRAGRRRNPNATVVAAGCYGQRSPEDLREMLGRNPVRQHG